MIIYEKRNLKIKGIIMKKTFLKKLVTASIAAVTALSSLEEFQHLRMIMMWQLPKQMVKQVQK